MTFRVVAFGSNNAAQLGNGHSDDTPKPAPCIFDTSSITAADEEVSAIVGGGNHSLLLSSKGRVWASGSNEQGRCGLATTTQQSASFRLVDIFSLYRREAEMVTSVAATWEASIFVLSRRSVLTCGVGHKGELGQGQGVTTSSTQKEAVFSEAMLDKGDEILDAIAGVNHILILTSSGTVFGWGASRRGQLGDASKADKVVWQPRKIETAFKVRKLVAGRDFTYIVGFENEQLFLGDAKRFPGGVSFPLERGGDHNSDLAGGWSNIYFQSSRLLAGVGRKDRGQMPPDDLPDILSFAAGSEHTLALTAGGKVISWGWGEHGNCGEPVDERGCVVNRYNTIPVSIQVGEVLSMVAAGCATSFIVLRKG